MNGETQQASGPVGRTRNSKAFLTKAGLVEEVSQGTQTTGTAARAMVEAIFESMILAIRSGDKVEIRGFGSFRTRARRARIGRNPRTGVCVAVPAKKIVSFKPGRDLLELLARIPPEAP